MKIQVFEMRQHEVDAFAALKQDSAVSFTEQPLTQANASDFADAEIISIFINSRIDRAALDQLTSLKMIATRSTGFDHIDVGCCAERAIPVCNVPSYGENTVAEHVFALLLSISHRLPEAIERARSSRFSPEGLEGFDLAGKTLGVVGAGNIGRHVIRIANGFAMTVVAHDIHTDPALAAALGFRYLRLDQLYAQSDIISLHLPATARTEGLIDAEAFAQMKDGVVIINTARGSIIDSQALVVALSSGKVAAAGLDVLPEEPLIREEAELIGAICESGRDLRGLLADHVLLRMPNVIITPHSAFNTLEAVRRIIDTTVANIDAFLHGAPQNEVAPKRD